MPTTTVNTFDTIEEWRLKTNELGVKIADLDNNLFTVNVIASGNVTASGNINALGNVVVTQDVRVTGNVSSSGNVIVSEDARVTGNIIGASNAVITGNVIAANILANVHYGTYVTSKPAINVLFNANITGSANLLISNSGTNILTISANVAPDSVTLGTHTIGNYVKEITSADTSNIIVNNGVGEGTTPTVNLAMTAVDPGVYGNANAVSTFSVTRDGRLTAASNVLIDRAYILTTGKPSINLTFTGDVAGAGNVNFSNENTNNLSIGLTVQPNSVALGTDTTGNYVENLVQGSGITLTGATPAEGGTPTIAANVRSVGSFVGDVSNTNLLSSLLQVDGSGSGLDADVLDGQNGTYYLDWANQSNKPAINLTFTGDVTGTGGVVLTNSGTNNLSIGLTIGADSIALGTDTTGNYTDRVVPGTGMTATGTTGEGNVITVGLATSGVTAGSYGNANVVSQITVDSTGRVTSASNVAIDRAYGLTTNKPSINLTFTGDVTGAGNINFSNENTNILSIALTSSPDSITLGTDTTGNYTDRVVPGTGISATGTVDEGNVITVGLTSTGVSAGSYGNANSVSQITVDAQGRISSASDVAIDRRYITVSEKPSINLRFVGDATGSGNITFSSSDKNELSISLSVLSTANVTGNAIPNTTVTAGTYGGASNIPFFTVDQGGRLTNAGNSSLVYSSVANKPSVNLTFTGDVTGSGSINLANENTNTLSIGLNIGADSVALGTDTTGNYVQSISSADTANIIVNSGTGEGSTPTVNLAMTGVTPGQYGNENIISQIIVDRAGRVTSASNVTPNYLGLTAKPAVNLTFTGDVTGSGSMVLSGSSTNSLSIGLTVAADSVALGTDTTGNYTDRVVPGTMITLTGTADEGNVITINHSDTSSLNGLQGGSGIASITVDDRGHVTAVTTATYCTSVPASSNVFSYFGGATGNTIAQTNQSYSSIGAGGTNNRFNFFAGRCAGNCINGGGDNVFFGSFAGCCATSGSNNNFFGCAAGRCTENASHNNFFGQFAGYCSTSANSNNFFGQFAGASNSQGASNNFFGFSSGRNNTTGSYNNFIGSSAGFYNTFGDHNNFFGRCVGCCNTNGSFNIFISCRAGQRNTTGSRNIYLGCTAGGNITTGNDNIIFGNLTSCVGLTASTSNVIIMATGGIQSFKIDSSNKNINLGTLSGNLLATGCHNIILGNCAACRLQSGCNNLIVGNCSGGCIQSGSFNTYIGTCSGPSGSGSGGAGSNNAYIGYKTGAYQVRGSGNFFGGMCTGRYMTGDYNTALGRKVGFYANNDVDTCNNIGIGTDVFFGIKTYDVNGNYCGCSSPVGLEGNFNLAIGYRAGAFLNTGNNNIFIGCCAGSIGGFSGLGCITTEDNKIIVGNSSHTSACIWISWSTPSDIRDKCIFGPVPHGKGFLSNVNPITFSFKNRLTGEITDDKKRYGFSAQNLLEAEGDVPIIIDNKNSERLGFTSDFLIPILVNAVKELTADVEILKAEIAELKKSR